MVKAWIISIVGVICLGVLLEIVLPEGKTAKYVRGAFSLLVLFVMISPLPALINKDWSEDISADWLKLDEGYVSSTYTSYAERMKTTAEQWLIENGMEGEVKIAMEEGTLRRIEVRLVSVDYNAEGLRTALAARLCVSKDKIEVLCAESDTDP